MKNNFKVILMYVLFIVVITVIAANLIPGGNKAETLEYSDILELFRQEKVESFVVSAEDTLTMQVRTEDGNTEEKVYKLRDLSLFYADTCDLVAEQAASGKITSYDYEPPKAYPWWISFLPYIIMTVLFVAFWLIMMRQMNGGGKIGNFGRARFKVGSDEKKRVTFADVAGADEEKEELMEVVEFLKHPGAFEKLGAKIPHGVLLMGPPGTGKTLLAKAVAGEANVPFYSISGSDFVEMYVGVGASRVRDLFETARRHPAAIVFIDEIDAVGRQRGTGLGGGHDEREQTLNQLLVEMDGFGTGSSAIIVMAATNRADILDPALLRPGRFDRQITVNYPDIRGREAILRVHAKGKPFESEVDFATVAKATVGFTGADLANLLNEAALLAARRGKALIGANDIEDAMMKVLMGPQKRSRKISDEDKKITAYHEAGHAIAAKLVCKDETVHQISIIPAGQAAGVTVTMPNDDSTHMTRNQMQNEIVMLLAGRAAEELVIGDITTGASNDIERATAIAHGMVTRYGMSEKLGTVVYGHDQGSVFLGRDFSSAPAYSESTAAMIDAEVLRIINEAYGRVRTLLQENRDKLDFIAAFLFKNEVMEADQFEAAMADPTPTIKEVEALRSERAKRSEAENEAAKRRREAEEAERRRIENEEIADLKDDGGDDGFPTPKD